VEAPVLMVGLADEIDAAIGEAVKGLRARGYSWAEIGSRLGITRQAGRPATLGADLRVTPRGQVDAQQPRARCVPDEAASRGNSRSLADAPTYPLTCTWTGPGMVAHVLLSSGSQDLLGRSSFPCLLRYAGAAQKGVMDAVNRQAHYKRGGGNPDNNPKRPGGSPARDLHHVTDHAGLRRVPELPRFVGHVANRRKSHC
jgi:hypothetical protein